MLLTNYCQQRRVNLAAAATYTLLAARQHPASSEKPPCTTRLGFSQALILRGSTYLKPQTWSCCHNTWLTERYPSSCRSHCSRTSIFTRKYICQATRHTSFSGNTKMAEVSEGMLLGFGNPLLDITIVTDESFLKKYDLEANNAILAEAKHQPLFEELTKYNPDYVAGGATQNSIRVAQWLLQRPLATTFFGCIGNDDNGKILTKRGEDDGMRVCYQVDPNVRTGVCAAIITGENRSLVAELGAAMKFSHTFLQQPENWKYVELAKAYYVGGFPFPVSPPSVKAIAEHACENNKLLVMNLSAPYLCKYFVDPDINIMPYIDVLFGNEVEAATFCKLAGIKNTELTDMALAVTKLPKKNPNRGRTVIFTHGKEPTVVAHDGKSFTWPISPIPKDLIKDTNGCGDAFVGGFLSQIVQNKPLEDCLRCGNYAARTIIQHFGCTYPPKPDF